jgi:hypothetical protein
VIEIYRRTKESVDSEWHFHTQCADWPELNYIQVRSLTPDERKRICPECARLEAKMFPQNAADKR